MEQNDKTYNQSGKLVIGLIITIIGFSILLDNFGVDFPSWVFYWSNILIIIGLIISFKHNFTNRSGIFLIVFGAFFTLKKAFDGIFDFDRVGWPILIIGVGLYLIFKPKNSFSRFTNRKGNSDETTPNDTFQTGPQSEEYVNLTDD